MPEPILTHLVPAGLDPSAFRGAALVVIDQLRASTTICAALHAGAARVVPFLEVAEAQAYKDARPRETCLTGGERGGERIASFDLGNSPGEYTAERVQGKTIAFTTTNGTKAALLGREAGGILVGCLGNLEALCSRLVDESRPIHLLCAGTRDRLTLEDVLAAGAIADELHRHGMPINQSDARTDDDSTRLAVELWRGAGGSPEDVLAALWGSRGGRNLIRIGLDADIEVCSRVNAFPVVPVLTPTGFELAG